MTSPDILRCYASGKPSRAGIAILFPEVSVRDCFRPDKPVRTAARTGKAAATAIARGAVLAAVTLATACGTSVAPLPGASPALPPRPVAPVPLTPGQAARLPLATTFATLRRAPQDPDPFGTETGLVAHPAVQQVIYASPGGPAVAALPVTELGSPTWVPVVQTQPGWERVLLPSRPNRSTGWIYSADGGLQDASSAFQVRIGLAARRLTVLDAGRSLGSWTVAVGAPATPTPAGRTFLLASLAPSQPAYSPLILPLGTHSATLDTYGGGPGTVALHGWPEKNVFGQEISHGCVRVPAAALRLLSRIPLGSFVMITR
jgi:lipoprotein-anchoring transpeptidase ErfK/SrfK